MHIPPSLTSPGRDGEPTWENTGQETLQVENPDPTSPTRAEREPWTHIDFAVLTPIVSIASPSFISRVLAQEPHRTA